MSKTGIYFIGARGNIAVTTMVGALAIREGTTPATGMVTSGPEFRGVGLPALDSFVFGGCDVADTDLVDKAEALAESRVFPASMIELVADELREINRRIHKIKGFPFGAVPDGGYLSELTRIEERIADFRRENGLDRVVVLNISSTEPHFPETEDFSTVDRLFEALKRNQGGFVTGTFLTAFAALRQGCAYVNFTPSQGSEVACLRQLARDSRLPHAGKDGKTGETLIKTVLGPMFLARNLKIMSWVGNNFLGNNDGAVLDDPASRDSKLRQKDAAVREMVGTDATVITDIRYVPSLGDWKTAWDLIHFQGFLGTPMTMTFTWQGCDSALAAPLVLDLARLTTFAWERDEVGMLAALSAFFKNPLDGHTHDFARQMDNLHTWIDGLRDRQPAAK